MEIERKFRMTESIPNLPVVERSIIAQSYLNLIPEVRIRKYESKDGMRYDLTIKSEGVLSRQEIIKDLTEDEYAILLDMTDKPPIIKEYYALKMGDYVLEYSRVDPGKKCGFCYAEVEFATEEEANAFTPPEYIGQEMTYTQGFKMKQYWQMERE